MNFTTTFKWPINTKKMKSVTIQEYNKNNKYTGSRDDDSSSENKWAIAHPAHQTTTHPSIVATFCKS